MMPHDPYADGDIYRPSIDINPLMFDKKPLGFADWPVEKKPKKKKPKKETT